MPQKMEKALRKRAKQLGLKGRHHDAFVFGTMRKMGWVPKLRKKK